METNITVFAIQGQVDESMSIVQAKLEHQQNQIVTAASKMSESFSTLHDITKKYTTEQLGNLRKFWFLKTRRRIINICISNSALCNQSAENATSLKDNLFAKLQAFQSEEKARSEAAASALQARSMEIEKTLSSLMQNMIQVRIIIKYLSFFSYYYFFVFFIRNLLQNSPSLRNNWMFLPQTFLNCQELVFLGWMLWITKYRHRCNNSQILCFGHTTKQKPSKIANTPVLMLQG